MKKLGFVVPWYGEKIPGGAEMELRGLTSHLKDAGVDLRILTTCVKQFDSDWNENYHKEGLTVEGGIEVMRFKVRKRDVAAFDRVNSMLMRGKRIKPEDQETFIREMVNSPALYEYMASHKDEYSLFVFIPYMFGTTVNGIKVAPEMSVLIPCLHDEAYAYMDILKQPFESLAGMVFNARPEEELAGQIFDLTRVHKKTIGVGVDINGTGDAQRFREKFKINEPFILYAGRKDEGKNVHTLVNYFVEYKKRNGTDLKLVLIGGGNIDLPREYVDSGDIRDLGFVDLQDKYDAQAASLLLCQPSKNESFSLVIMESWINKRPVLVHEDCKVTQRFVTDFGGGLYFKTYFEFEGCVDYISNNPDTANAMGLLGQKAVTENFAWDVVVSRYMEFFKLCSEALNGKDS